MPLEKFFFSKLHSAALNISKVLVQENLVELETSVEQFYRTPVNSCYF